MRRGRAGGTQGRPTGSRLGDDLYVTLELSDSEESLGSLTHEPRLPPGSQGPGPASILPKIPVHLFSNSRKDKFYSEKKKNQKTKGKGGKQRGDVVRKQAWEEQSDEEVKDYEGSSVGDDSGLDDDQSLGSASELLSPSPQQTSFPSPISPGKRAFFNSASPLHKAASPAGSFGSPSSSMMPSPSGSSVPVLFSPSKNQLLSVAASSNSYSASPDAPMAIKQQQEKQKPLRAPPLPQRMRAIQKNLAAQQELIHHDEKLARMQLIASADRLVSELPLRYLLSKPELRHYAVERVVRPFMRLLVIKARVLLRWAFVVWLRPPEVRMNEKQARFMVIADCLAKLLRRVFRHAFEQWAHFHSSRHMKKSAAMQNKAAEDIQNWYRHTKIVRTESFKWFTTIIESCLRRRKAIKHFIYFEQLRRAATFKLRRAIHHKRRIFYGARSIMRVWRWTKLFRKTQQRLTRRVFAKVIQRWYRMVQTRDEKALFLIHKVIQHGGYSVVLPKAKLVKSQGKSHYERLGFLETVNACAVQIQRAWYRSKGQSALFILFAARRARAEYEKMLNDNATIIQQNFRGHLWNLLCLAGVQWNRSRRISKGYRAYSYRVWDYKQHERRRQRMARKIQHFARIFLFKLRLAYRFKLRKALLIFTRAKKTLSAMMIQRQYRAHVERERIKHELLVAFIAQQRAQAELVAKNISKIQRNWRQLVTKTFPEHVKLVCLRIVRDRRRALREAALMIQKPAKPWVRRIVAKRKALHIKMANKIWRYAKARLLALAIWDRVEARRRKEKLASICMCRNFRLFLFYRGIKTRCLIRAAIKSYHTLVYNHATYIQRWMRRKALEYMLPVRLAARRNLQKKRVAEDRRRQQLLQDKSANMFIRFFRQFPPWNRFLKRVAKDRRYYLERVCAKKMQRFARMVIAWARFDRVVAYRQKCVHEQEVLQLWAQATNVVGHYWKRFREKTVLSTRFNNRRNMLDEWHRLEELRLKAMKERAVALEDKRRTDENMRATIAAAWKQGSDTAGKNYYYNYVTGESAWVAPEGWKVPHAVDKWIRQLDERQNVYYYNMQTTESSWLPPCGICGDQSERYCGDCSIAYCETCFERRHHGEDQEDEDDAKHEWSLVEYEKQKLGPGDVYCLECKKRVAMRMCLTCWDPYCNECFAYTHHVGDLKYHKTMAYKKVKAGWMVVKSKDVEGDDGNVRLGDYYINGNTGESTYEKPEELFTPQEKLFFENFQSHKKAHEEALKKIEDLQYKLEEASFERDSILQDNLSSGNINGAVTSVLKKRAKKKAFGDQDHARAAQVDVVAEVQQANKPGPMAWLLGDKTDYKNMLLNPNPRQRGAQRSDFLKTLIDDGDKIAGGAKKKK